MKSAQTPLLLSLKPRYADLIFGGSKRAELRRRVLRLMEGRDVFIYVTSPVMELRGGFRVGRIWTGTREEIWAEVSRDAGVDRPDFDSYYAGRKVACALEITDVWEYTNPIGLNRLRNQLQNYVVPQSWRYVKSDEHSYFQMMRRDNVANEGNGSTVQPPEKRTSILLQPAVI